MDINALLKQMTLEEKIGQLIQLPSYFFGDNTELTGPAQDWGLTKEQMSTIGSCLGFDDPEKIRKTQERHLESDRNKIPLLFMRDVIHGYRTVYPIGLGLSCSFDEDLFTECTKMAAKEASAFGQHVTFAPMVDLARDARWGRVMETCGEEPLLGARFGAAQVKAYQGDDLSSPDNIAACVKHFAAYGGAEAGKDYNYVEISERSLRQFYLPSYKACIDAGVKMLMPSFNDLNGIPSTANSFLMKQILKDEWGFDGLVVSDWAAVHELCKHGVAEDLREAAQLAFDNGCHIEMASTAYYKNLANLINEGIIPEAELDKAVLKVLSLKEELGLFEDPYHGASAEKIKEVCLCDEHRAIARKACEESAVLLKNDGLLPLSEDIRKIALIGPFATSKEIIGPWAGNGKVDEAVSIYEGIRALLPNAEIVCAEGCSYLIGETDRSGFTDAIEAAKGADAVIVCVGEPHYYSGEGNSRADIVLPGIQAELVNAASAANSNCVAVIFNGRPLALTNIYENTRAILDVWFPGTEGGNAIANLLFGRANPSGKLVMSFPKAVGQCPIYYNRLPVGRPKTTPEDVYQPFCNGYRDCGVQPLFFFGEGLSYTTFSYENMTLDKKQMSADEKIKLTVTVKNTGDRAGKETVQLYLRDKVSSLVRPVQELIDFKKIELDAGESAKVVFEISEPMLRFWTAKGNYASEPGEFDIFVGYADHKFLCDSFRLI